MTFKKLEAPSLTELFVNEIERMILGGELKVGQKLPSERKLAEEMNVSLAVVHVGITKLANIGFLIVEPRKGVTVADFVRNGNIDTLAEIISYTNTFPDRDSLDTIVQFRRGMEVPAIMLACRNRTEQMLEELTELIQKIEAADIQSLPELAFSFQHTAIIASGNTCYPMITQSFRAIYVMFYRTHLEAVGREAVVNYLKSIYSIIKDQDVDAAEEVINTGIDNWINLYIEQHF